MRKSAKRFLNLKRGTGLAKLIFDLGDLLERHIRKEERELFPLFEQHVEGGKAESAGVEIKRILAICIYAESGSAGLVSPA